MGQEKTQGVKGKKQGQSINGVKTSDENFNPGLFTTGRLLLRRGKAFKDSALVELS